MDQLVASWLMLGCLCPGRGDGIVVSIGEQTEFGVIFATMQDVSRLPPCSACGGSIADPPHLSRSRRNEHHYKRLWMS